MSDLPRKSRTLKTYSRAHKRQRSDDSDARIIKRKRVGDELPVPKPRPRPFSTVDAWLRSSRPLTPVSQPSSGGDAVFSDHSIDAVTATPPSSPPPLLPESKDEPEQNDGGDTGTVSMLAPLSINVRGNSALPMKSKVLETPLVQMQINLGSILQKTCRECGMTFVHSNPSDNAIHDKYHARNVNGVNLGKAFRKWADSNAIWRGPESRLVVVVDGKNASLEKRKAREVLDLVQTELGAVDIPDCDLWATAPREGIDRESHYRAYLYMAGLQCVGLCLAKRIAQARRVVNWLGQDESDGRGQEEALNVAEESQKAEIGISRIWISKSHRQRGIGTALLDCVAQSFTPNRPVQKAGIAFSQPTTSGTALARKWFGKQYGWLVYVE